MPGQCPGVPGYCSLDQPGGLCTFECISGPHIRSSCLPDGTWDPYPTCEGDVRETKDGCDPCPGPFGGPRNRTVEAGAGGGSRNSGAAKKSGGSSGRGGGSGGHSVSSGARRSGAGSRRNSAQTRNTGGKRKQSAGGRRANKNKGGTRRNGGGSKSGGRPSSKKTGGVRKGGSRGAGGCPDSVLEACIDACPGASAKVFGACVAGCSKRCS